MIRHLLLTSMMAAAVVGHLTLTGCGAKMALSDLIDEVPATPVFSGKFITPLMPDHPSAHGSTVIALPSGEVLAAWYAGEGEKRSDVAIFVSRLAPQSTTWSEPKILIDHPGLSEGNPVWFMHPDGRLFLYYVTMYGNSSWDTCKIHYRVSRDQGHTWGDEFTLREELGWMTRHRPIVLGNGDFVFPLYNEIRWSAEFLISSDQGRTWTHSQSLVSYPLNLQPSVIERSDSSLVAYMRADGGKLLKSRSADYGQSWSPVRFSGLPNPNASAMAINLLGGKVGIVYNDSPNSRDHLTLAISEDGGDTFPVKRLIQPVGGDYHYPYIDQADDGTIHITYTYFRDTIKHVMCNEAWVRSGEVAE
ncbi:MAG: exo-alpha-sialidase [Candidatus Latescibacteria bacterium]|nr:exo-alpha-sialidase [Candidatus Latescibacterota bacterium]